jgi:peptide chain release factor subunit 1
MFAESDLRELLDFSTVHLVLSLYLNINPSEGNADAYRLRLRNMLKEVNLPQDTSAIERFFNSEFDWSGKGVVVFSCAADGFLRAFPLALPVRDLVHVSNRPVLKPLMDLLDSYGGYGVVLVDKQGARLFHFHLGELREQEGVLGANVKHTKYGGASTVPGRRGGIAGRTHRVDETIDRNMKVSAEFSVHFFENNRIRRVLIAGSDENINLFRAMLPKAWQSLIVGTFIMPMTASHTEVLAHAMQTGNEAEARRKERLVENLITQSAKAHSATVGLENTLQAVNNERVQTLVVMEGFRSGGAQCQSCGLLTIKDVERCPVCDGEMASGGVDVVDLAVNKIVRHGGEVEVILKSPMLEKVGWMGALLRY